MNQPALFERLSGKKAVIIVFALILGLRLAHYATTLHEPYIGVRVGDEAEYHEWAERIASGHLLRDHAFFTTPLYAYFLAVLYVLGASSIAAVRFANVVLDLASLLLIYRTAALLFRKPFPLLSLILAGFCISPLWYGTFPEKTSLVLFLTSFSVFLVTTASGRRKPFLWLLAGVASGITALGHAVLLTLAPAACLQIASQFRHERTAMVKTASLFLAGFFLAVMPATLHNYLVDRDFVLINYNGGQNFYAGNNARNLSGTYSSPGSFTANIRHEEEDYVREAERRTGRALKPSETSSYWFRRGWQDMEANPGLAATRVLRRLRWTFNSAEPTDTRFLSFYRERLLLLRLPLLPFGVISLFGLAGLALTIRDARFLFLNALVLLFAFLLSSFFVYGRYRLPLLAPLSLLAAAAAMNIADRIQAKTLSRAYVMTAGALLLVLGIIVLPPSRTTAENGFFMEYYNHGKILQREGAADAALAEYAKALAADPDHYYAGRLIRDTVALLLQLDRDDQADALLRTYGPKHADDPFVREAECTRETKRVLLSAKGRRDFVGANAACTAALDLRPDSWEVLMNSAALRILRGDLDGAEREYQTALGYYRNDAGLWVRVSRFHAEYRKDRGRALREAEEAVRLAPENKSAREWLASLMQSNVPGR